MTVKAEDRTYSKKEPLMDVETFKKRFLHGVDLRDGDGVEMEDSQIQMFLDVAVDYLEHELECPIIPQDFVEKVDYKYADYKQYVYIQLRHYPVTEVEEVNLIYGDTITIEFPEEWFKVYGRPGQIQLLPTFGSFQRLVFTTIGQIAPAVLYGKYAPQLIHVKGKYGLADSAGEVQPIINQAVGLMAAIYILQMIGDISPSGPGVSSSSLSMDGLSQSLSTAISATNNLFGASILKYNDLLDKKVLPMLKRHYKRIKMVYI